MADHARGSQQRDLLERLALAALGAVSLTGERAEQLAEDLAARGGIRRDEARDVIEEAMLRWRGDATRIGERVGDNVQALAVRLGLATKAELEELELRTAQLEHRLRLLEGAQPPAGGPSVR